MQLKAKLQRKGKNLKHKVLLVEIFNIRQQNISIQCQDNNFRIIVPKDIQCLAWCVTHHVCFPTIVWFLKKKDNASVYRPVYSQTCHHTVHKCTHLMHWTSQANAKPVKNEKEEEVNWSQCESDVRQMQMWGSIQWVSAEKRQLWDAHLIHCSFDFSFSLESFPSFTLLAVRYEQSSEMRHGEVRFWDKLKGSSDGRRGWMRR